MTIGDLFKISESVGNGIEKICKNRDLPTPLVRTSIDSQTFDFFLKAISEFCRISQLFFQTERPYLSFNPARELLVEQKKNFVDESSHAFSRGHKTNKKKEMFTAMNV